MSQLWAQSTRPFTICLFPIYLPFSLIIFSFPWAWPLLTVLPLSYFPIVSFPLHLENSFSLELQICLLRLLLPLREFWFPQDSLGMHQCHILLRNLMLNILILKFILDILLLKSKFKATIKQNVYGFIQIVQCFLRPVKQSQGKQSLYADVCELTPSVLDVSYPY